MDEETHIIKKKSDNLRVGIVLSSGGLRGVYAHTGFLSSIDNMKLNIQAIAGCSAGAIVGGIYASGTPIKEWSNTLSKMVPKQFWSPSITRMLYSFIFRKGRGYIGFSTTQAAMELCDNNIKAKTFETCVIPFYTLAKNILHGCKTVFHSGTLTPRIAASAAIPLMYEPVEIDDQFYCDGALLELSPTDAICCKHQLDVLVIHHVARRYKGKLEFKQVLKRPWSIIEMLNMLLYQQRPWYLSDEPLTFRKCPCGCDAIIIVVEPELSELSWPATKNGVQIMEEALQQTENLLKPYLQNLTNNKVALMEKVNAIESNFVQEISCGVKN